MVLDWLDRDVAPPVPPTWVEEGEPRIRPGLVLRIAVTASGEAIVKETLLEVSYNGEILLPLISAIKCDGLTLAGLQEEIVKAYKVYYHDPQVTVSFAYNPNDPSSIQKSPWGEVLVMGAVLRTGPVNMPPTRDLRVTKALMLQGNPTPLGDKSGVRVFRRQKDGKIAKFKVNLDKISRGHTELDIELKSGDVVYVPETWY